MTPSAVGRHRHVCRRASAAVIATAALVLTTLSLESTASASPRLAKPGSTHPSFPLDAFAKPAFSLVFVDNEPIGNATAKEVLRRGREWHGREDGSGDGETGHEMARFRSHEFTGTSKDEAAGAQAWPDFPFRAFLHRSNADSLYVCTLAEPQDPNSSKQQLFLDDAGVAEYRRRVLSRALELLAPLKDTCLYHTLNWFTYSLCYGDAIKQFRALSGGTVSGKAPTPDPSKPSFVLGRWREGIESIRDEEAAGRSSSHAGSRAAVTDGIRVEEAEPMAFQEEKADLQSKPRSRFSLDARSPTGTDLMELVHFSSLDETPDATGESKLSSYASLEGKGRYISQTWTDGTLCDMNDEPRTAEVQYHCAETPVRDRISYVKEVTTCNYIVVIETSRLCQEPALKQKADEIREVQCRPILSDVALQAHLQQRAAQEQASFVIDAGKTYPDKESQEAAAESSSTGEDEDKAAKDPSLQNVDKSNPQNDADQLARRATLQQIVDDLRVKLQDRQTPGAQQQDIEIVVGWDENGQFIIEPRREGAVLDLEEVFGNAKLDEGKKHAQAHDLTGDEGAQAGERPTDSPQDPQEDMVAAATQHLRHLLRKVEDMHVQKEGRVDPHGDADQPTAAQGQAPPPPQAAEAQPRAPAHKQPSSHAAEDVVGSTHQQVAHPQERTVPVREPETLGSRVERFFKLQDADKAKEDESNQVREADSDDGREQRRRSPLRPRDEL